MKLNCLRLLLLLPILGSLTVAPAFGQSAPGDSAAATNVAGSNAPRGVLPEDPLPGSTNPVETTGTDTNGVPAEELNQELEHGTREIVLFRNDALVKSNETAGVVVVIGGSAVVHGKVNDAVVAIGGNIDLTGECQEAVAIFGNINMSGDAKAGEVVAILGNIFAKGNASGSEAVSVGGSVNTSENAKFPGGNVSLQIPGISAPEWLHEWFRECVMKLRPFAPGVGWLWVIAGIVIGFYFLVAMLFRTPVKACRNVILERPATTLMVGFLVKMLSPLVIFIIAATGIGLFIVPFVIVGLTIMGIFGKAALLEAIGAALGRAFGAEIMQKPALAFLIGAMIVLVLYMVPILGLLVFLLLGVWALGAATLAISAGMKRERRPISGGGAPRPQYATATAGAAGAHSYSSGTSPNLVSGEPFADSATSGGPTPPASADMLPPRYASFWQRMGAAFLDIVLVLVVSGLAGGGKLFWLVAIAYFAGMWTWRGTTLGGVVLGLKVVRVDGRHLSFLAALVRSITAVFSAICLFLGFFWIAWDADKQGWHDKVAGTVVVKEERSAPLVCL